MNAVVRLAVGLGPWNFPGREAGETVKVSAGETRERGRGSLETVERVSWGDRGTVGESVGSRGNRGRDAVETGTWVGLGNRAGAVVTGVWRGIAAGEHKE